VTWHPDMPEEYKNAIVTGDARELARRIPDESIDLIFTDPVYDRIDDYRWLAETAARVLKPNCACLVWTQVGLIPECLASMRTLTYRWILVHYKPGRVIEKFGAVGYSKWEPLLWYDKGRLPRRRWVDVFQSMPFQSDLPMAVNHDWSKDPDALAKVLEAFSATEAVVYDPFTGGGTVPAVCKILGRNYVASEIDPDVAERARDRVRDTQPPLFVLQPEQQEFAL
jgi:site-specific DNA-methyltransferase (adenine-specific)